MIRDRSGIVITPSHFQHIGFGHVIVDCPAFDDAIREGRRECVAWRSEMTVPCDGGKSTKACRPADILGIVFEWNSPNIHFRGRGTWRAKVRLFCLSIDSLLDCIRTSGIWVVTRETFVRLKNNI